MNLRLGLDPNNLSTLCRRCPYCSHPEREWSNFLSNTSILLSIKTAKEWQSSKWYFAGKLEDMRRMQNWDKYPQRGKMASIFREGDPLDSKYQEWDTSEILWPQKGHIQEILQHQEFRNTFLYTWYFSAMRWTIYIWIHLTKDTIVDGWTLIEADALVLKL